MTCPTRTSRAGSGVTTIRSPGTNDGFMLPERTVSTRYQPVRGRSPRPTNTAIATTAATPRARSTMRRAVRASAAVRAEWARSAIEAALLARRCPLRSRERVLDRRRLVLQGVAGAAWERKLDAVVRRRARAQRTEAEAALDHGRRGDHACQGGAARVRVGLARLRPGGAAFVDPDLQAVRRVGVEQ